MCSPLRGVQAALDIGQHLSGGYHVLVSSGAQRATQTLGCFLAALGQTVPAGVVVEPALRSQVEDRWHACGGNRKGSRAAVMAGVEGR